MAVGSRTLENLVTDSGFWRGKRVFLTGHTGFKGGWLAIWLESLGASVFGYALAPVTTPSLFEIAGVGESADSTLADIRDGQKLSVAMQRAAPDIVFHLAAQPLVRASYRDPVETYATNVMGTVHLLEAVRQIDSVRAVVVVTTDKCYDNREWEWGYRENDPLGGYDPYSSSKAAAELVTAAYRNSFFLPPEVASVASARAGNVIGGGDWAEDRLIPDIVRAVSGGAPVRIRNPNAIRPWQHVVEPLAGYLQLAQRLYSDGAGFAQAWNFGPEDRDARTVGWIARHVTELWGDGASWVVDEGEHPHEANFLKLDISKARQRLGWAPRLDLETALEWTTDWYRSFAQGADMRNETLEQIANYESRN
jgi:CDP-glucose 4,6-dehydratase